MFSTDYPVLLSLRDRLKDVAAYINKFIDSSQKQAIGTTGLAQLLHYPWPGGYMELQEKMKHLCKRIEDIEFVTSEHIAEMLGGNDFTLDSPDEGFGLSAFLKRRQNEYINLHRKQYEDLKDTVLRLGIDSDRVSVEAVMEGKQLAFPGILEA
jgi:transcriptional regulator with PAS, ATPase and Fis domain